MVEVGEERALVAFASQEKVDAKRRVKVPGLEPRGQWFGVFGVENVKSFLIHDSLKHRQENGLVSGLGVNDDVTDLIEGQLALDGFPCGLRVPVERFGDLDVVEEEEAANV